MFVIVKNNEGQGRYGSVWRGTLRELEVAVKIFPGHYPPELLLVLSYAPLGCLQDFLRHTTPDWPTFCRMSASISSGLAHLHTDIKKGESAKPCVSHRDLNSRNILVKADLSCCICDLGLAMKISGSKYYCNGEEQRAETKSINDVGTLRYMAPEVLEGAVNLRDCESSLKQIDVYALGLVLWELAVRCPDLYVMALETPPYRLPFEAEIGLHPTFEQMQVLVSRHKARPLLPETWRETACVRLLRETIEDCWDQDAEARLTALCVDERLRELPTTWERHRGTMYASGVSPTVNLTSSQVSTAPANNNNYNNHNNNNNHNGLLHCTLDNRLHLPEVGPEEPGPHQSRHLDKDAMDSTVSEGTVETLVTLSPSEPGPNPMCKNAQLANSQQTMPSALQPYQGRNPCLERNLMSLEPEPQLLANGNTLVDLSAMTASATDEVAAESHSLLAHDSLQHNATTSTALRPATPIPFVQNAVFETDPLSSNTTANGGCPKQPNVPGNGRRPTSHVPSRWSWLLGNGMRLRLFSDTSSGRRKHPQTHHNRSSTGSALLLRDVGNAAGTREATTWEDETKSSNLSRSPPPLSSSPPAAPQLVKTKVSLKQGSPVCTKEVSPPPRPRPSSLALGSPDWLKSQRQMRPPSAHIKTPKQHAPSGRFSLYDDRIMSEQLVVTTEGGRETRATSVPGDIMNC
ncbi:hypothetical protein B566_EDAN010528 [Ephemera danica]|nr:hypothetical protein B566_EDAN010528 [Ephemera danica]